MNLNKMEQTNDTMSITKFTLLTEHNLYSCVLKTIHSRNFNIMEAFQLDVI